MANLKYFLILLSLSIGFLVIGCILCPPSFWDSILLPPGSELPTFEITPLNFVGFGLTCVGLVTLTVTVLKSRLTSKGPDPIIK